MIAIRVQKEEDRFILSAILVRNGYRVEQRKEIKPGTKTTETVLVVEDMRGAKR